MYKPLVVITGKNGQLGWELSQLKSLNTFQFDFLFIDKEELDLSNPDSIPAFFKQNKPKYFVNCGAYTLVDKAETERDLTRAINATSVGVIAAFICVGNCSAGGLAGRTASAACSAVQQLWLSPLSASAAAQARQASCRLGRA